MQYEDKSYTIEIYSSSLVLYSHVYTFLKKPTQILQFLLSFFILF